jgi:hypothetical protein
MPWESDFMQYQWYSDSDRECRNPDKLPKFAARQHARPQIDKFGGTVASDSPQITSFSASSITKVIGRGLVVLTLTGVDLEKLDLRKALGKISR